MPKFTHIQIDNDLKLLSQLTQKQREQYHRSRISRIRRAFKRHDKIIQQEEKNKNSWKKTGFKVLTWKQILDIIVVGTVKEVKLRETEGTFILTEFAKDKISRVIGLGARDIIVKDIGKQSAKSAELCLDPTVPWQSHSTEEHWWPAQHSGHDLFISEYNGTHKEGDIMKKLERYREIVYTTKDENQRLRHFQTIENFVDPLTSYTEAGIILVDKVKLPSGK